MTGRPGLVLPLHVEEVGAGRPLVLLHGLGAHSYTWRHWIRVLSGRHRLLLVDLKGHGSAPAPGDDAYGASDQAALVSHLVRERRLRSATLIGHSFGGAVALLTAVRLLEAEPERLHSLVVIEGAALPQSLPLYLRILRAPLLGPALLRAVPSRRLVRAVLRDIVHDPDRITSRQVEAYAEVLRSAAHRRALVQTARHLDPPEAGRFAEDYARIDVPTLVLWGRHDPVVPLATGTRLGELLPDARLRILEDCGHLPQEERPEASLEVVLEFLRSIEGNAGEAAG